MSILIYTSITKYSLLVYGWFLAERQEVGVSGAYNKLFTKLAQLAQNRLYLLSWVNIVLNKGNQMIVSTKSYIIALSCIVLAECTLVSKVVIFDLGGVLTELSYNRMAQSLFGRNTLAYVAWDWQNPLKIKDRALQLLGMWRKENTLAHKDRGRMPNGTPMPTLLCLWQSGLISHPEIIKEIELLLKDLDNSGHFKNQREKAIISDVLAAMFNPTLLADNITPIAQAVQLLARVARTPDRDGKRNELFILSNWDLHSFALFRHTDRGRSIFDYFNPENIVISGHIGALKPSPACFKAFFSKHKQIKPADCIFIDDQPENIQAAIDHGILHGILLEDSYIFGFMRYGKDYGKLRKKLHALGVFGKA